MNCSAWHNNEERIRKRQDKPEDSENLTNAILMFGRVGPSVSTPSEFDKCYKTVNSNRRADKAHPGNERPVECMSIGSVSIAEVGTLSLVAVLYSTVLYSTAGFPVL